mmetsp:Transcript_80213/g.111060  ORF Transcript_80213/g.111060 Transcript_80213/m.111060 type:complete len:198 (+) Transcript_80213:445-1038(+)
MGLIDQTNEKRYFSSETSGADATQSRINGKANPYLPNSGTQTMIAGTSNAAKELQKISYPNVSTEEKNISKGISRLREVADLLNLRQDDVMNYACELMKKIEKSGDLRGRSMEAKVATIIFTASRATGKARTIAQIWKHTDTTKKEVSTCYKKIKSLFPEETDKARLQPSAIVETACNKLKLPADVTKAAKITAVNI